MSVHVATDTARRIPIAVVADDVTGACEVAGAVAGAGTGARVALSAAPCTSSGVGIIVRVADVRDAAPIEAARTVREAFASFASRPVRAPYLKVDSTLRGPIGSMIDGAVSALSPTGTVVALAFPEQGRHVREGDVVVDGRCGGAAVGAPPRSVVDAVASIGSERRGDRPPVVVRTGEDLVRRLNAATAGGETRLVVDGESADDLDIVARVWLDASPTTLLVGSAGVARAIARVAAPGPGQPAIEPTRGGSGIIVVLGSPTATTVRQCDVLVRNAGLAWSVDGRTGVRRAIARPGTDASMLVMTVPALGPKGRRDADVLANELATAAAAATQERRPRALVLGGGATAAAFLAAVGATSLVMVGELAPGFPHGWISDGSLAGVRVATKAGTFGADDALVGVIAALSGEAAV